ncbi:hypothetical protein RSSM_01410 [Rhodopirellula sallentina SM41]|uniref:Uncharacterized protein n=1 Tax=Rhodopirellula sallentina SM41 TaxID=1263870 RepID=M5UM95_9BACT|nr:hypothetical protein RSSM_01410 [Rhodopirellula sallentina SM41]
MRFANRVYEQGLRAGLSVFKTMSPDFGGLNLGESSRGDPTRQTSKNSRPASDRKRP